MSKVELYRKKTVTLQVVQYTGSKSCVSAIQSINTLQRDITVHADHLDIGTLEGTMRADLGDFIIQGVKGEIYPCKPEIFAELYEPAEPTTTKDSAAPKEPAQAKLPLKK